MMLSLVCSFHSELWVGISSLRLSYIIASVVPTAHVVWDVVNPQCFSRLYNLHSLFHTHTLSATGLHRAQRMLKDLSHILFSNHLLPYVTPHSSLSAHWDTVDSSCTRHNFSQPRYTDSCVYGSVIRTKPPWARSSLLWASPHSSNQTPHWPTPPRMWTHSRPPLWWGYRSLWDVCLMENVGGAETV